jgi:F-type H+-transporting ATPase subunit delta
MSVDRSANLAAGYAQALLAVARAEGNVETTRNQLGDIARAFEANDELVATLGNNLLPVASRLQIVDDLLSGKATDTVRALVGMVVSAGRGGEFASIVDEFRAAAAAAGGKRVATVRTAVPLTDDQKSRLAHALSTSIGSAVELENIVDPEVVGGAVTTIGDTVIDGTVRTRLNKLRDAL